MVIPGEQLDDTILELCGATLGSVLDPLLGLLREYEALPFSCSRPVKRFRSTVQATCLLSLCRCGLIGSSDRGVLQRAVLSMRDSWHHAETDFAGGLVPPNKPDEDAHAWCVTETPSLWATSYAVWSLLASGYEEHKDAYIWPATKWILSQQDEATGGFAYQRHVDCVPTVYLTCLTIKALRRALDGTRSVVTKPCAARSIRGAISRALDFVEECARDVQDTLVFARHPDIQHASFDWVSTIWAYTALTQNRNESAPQPQRLFHILRRELADQSKFEGFWHANNFVNEAHTKFGGHKSYYYFMPSLLVPLIGLGLDPLDPICGCFLQNLRETFLRTGWPIVEYRRAEICTFSTSLALQTISSWACAAPSVPEIAGRLVSLGRTGFAQIAFAQELDKLEDQYREQTSQVREEYAHGINRLRRTRWSAVPLSGVVLSAFVVPWRDWIVSRSPLLMPVVFIQMLLCLWIVWLWTEKRHWRAIVIVIGLLGALATLVSFVSNVVTGR